MLPTCLLLCRVENSDGQETPVMLPPAVAVGQETLSVHRGNNCWVRLAGSRSLGLMQKVWSTQRLGAVNYSFGFLGRILSILMKHLYFVLMRTYIIELHDCA